MANAKKINTGEIVNSFVESFGKKSPGLRLQKRDYDVLGFILDQKFASLEMIYLCHFTGSKTSKGTPKNYQTVRQRLAKLRKNGLLKVEKVPSEGKGLYLLTKLGLSELENHTGKRSPVRETGRIDFSLYDHDRRLGMIRALMEGRGRCLRWWSEKVIRRAKIPVIEGGRQFGKELIPDAILVNPKGERIALEVEVSRKGLRKVRDKVWLYRRYIDDGIIDKVWVVATKPAIVRTYREAIRSSGAESYRFRIDPYDKVVPEDE